MNRCQLYFLCCVLAVMLCTKSSAQNTYLTIGTQIPLQYTLGIEHDLSPKFSASINAGILTKPYDKIILQVMNAVGTDAAITNTIGSSFSYGAIIQPSFYWHWNKKYYCGIYGQYMYLRANDTPKDAIESYYGVDFNASGTSHPSKGKHSGTIDPDVSVSVNSTLFNAGLLIGRKFFFGNSRFNMKLEFAFAKTIGSKSSISTGTSDYPNLSNAVNQALKPDYWNYGYLPTTNVYLAYRLDSRKK